MKLTIFLTAMSGLSCGIAATNKMMRIDPLCDQILLHQSYVPALIDLQVQRWYQQNRRQLMITAMATVGLGVALLAVATSPWMLALAGIWIFTGLRCAWALQTQVPSN